jgi:hypothetical protein
MNKTVPTLLQQYLPGVKEKIEKNSPELKILSIGTSTLHIRASNF